MLSYLFDFTVMKLCEMAIILVIIARMDYLARTTSLSRALV